MKKMDFNCYCGNWPFYRVRYNTIEKLSALHARQSIEGGFVSAMEAIFYQDPYEAEKALAKDLEGTAYMQALILNPTLTGWKDDLRRAVKELNIKAVRLMPGFHNYTLADDCVQEACDAIREYQLPLLLTMRIRDERTAWIFSPRSLPIDEIAAFLDKNKDILTILACARSAEVAQLKAQFDARDNLFTEMSGFKDCPELSEVAALTVAKDRILYGSSAPLLEINSTTIMLERSLISDDDKENIFSGKYFLAQMNSR